MSIALFSPFTLRKLKLANRIVVSPMCQYSAVVLGAQIQAPKQYWRSPPRETPNVISHAKVGMR